MTASSAVTGIALLDTICSELRIEASVDGFAHTVFSQTLAVSGAALLSVNPSVVPAVWRAVAVASGSVGLLYAGALIEISPPSDPWGFEQHQAADDRVTQGGIGYSRLLYTARSGNWTFEEIPDAEVANWRTWYAATAGFRLPFVAEDPLTGAAYLVRAPGAFPLSRQRVSWWGGKLAVREVLGAP